MLILLINILLTVWVFKDMHEQKIGRALWVPIVLLTGIFGAILYAIVRNADLRAKLRDRITFEFKNSSITEACRYLAELTDTTILVDPDIAKEPTRVTLPKMTDLTFDHALRWLCRFWRATYVVRDHVILVTRPGGRLNEAILRDYDVTGLLMPLRSIRTTLIVAVPAEIPLNFTL